MSREDHRASVESTALHCLALHAGSWVGAHELSEKHKLDWRSVARALQRLSERGVVSKREVEVIDSRYRKKTRREYKLIVTTPMLAIIPAFDPSKLNIVGVRVIRMEK